MAVLSLTHRPSFALRFGRESLILRVNSKELAVTAATGVTMVWGQFKTGIYWQRVCAAVVVMCALAGTQAAHAVIIAQTDPDVGQAHLSGASTVFDLATRFMRQLGTEAGSASTGAPLVNNPRGGGADLAVSPEKQRPWRAWFEGYGMVSRMSAQGAFPGDGRKTWGGVAGIGYTPQPGMSFGLSVDQSRTKIDLNAFPQTGTIDLTQVGANAAFDSGNWTFALAAIHGFGGVETRRDDLGQTNIASYTAKLWGALGEISYLVSLGDARIVPKVGADWARVKASTFTETGGVAVTGSDQVSSRTRLFAGAEIGRSWTIGSALLDLSAYGRGIDIVQQDISQLVVTGAGGPISLQGVGESRLGLDAGAAATLRLSAMTRLYVSYDGRFRENFTSHGGTGGIEFRW